MTRSGSALRSFLRDLSNHTCRQVRGLSFQLGGWIPNHKLVCSYRRTWSASALIGHSGNGWRLAYRSQVVVVVPAVLEAAGAAATALAARATAIFDGTGIADVVSIPDEEEASSQAMAATTNKLPRNS